MQYLLHDLIKLPLADRLLIIEQAIIPVHTYPENKKQENQPDSISREPKQLKLSKREKKIKRHN